jgi:hypothetical protein
MGYQKHVDGLSKAVVCIKIEDTREELQELERGMVTGQGWPSDDGQQPDA